MRILFNASKCGLGNNGGSRTIIKSAEALDRLGHEAIVWANINQYSKEHKACIFNDSDIITTDDFDTIINVSAWEIKETLAIDHPNKYWWLRLWEDYVNGVNIAEYVKKIPMIVNSKGLQDKLWSYGIKSELIYQGIDVDFWRRKEYTITEDKPVIGFLAHNKKRKRFNDAIRIIDELESKFYYYAIGESRNIDNSIRQILSARSVPLVESLDEIRMRRFYSQCDIWLQTSESEGLSNMPMEAALCGCLIVANSKEGLSGCDDYQSYIMDYNNVRSAVYLLNEYPFAEVDKFKANCKKEIVNKIGSRERCMEKMVKYIGG